MDMEKIIEKRLRKIGFSDVMVLKKCTETEGAVRIKSIKTSTIAKNIASDIEKELRYLNRKEVEKIFMTYADETEHEAQLYILGSDVSEIVGKICDLVILTGAEIPDE
jgi:hypothetical protein